MYNSEIKTRFIEEREQDIKINPGYLTKLFKKTAILERHLNKDLCNFNYYDILDLIKGLHCTSIRVVAQYKSTFSTYVGWCLHQGLVVDGQNHFEELVPDVYSQCINQLIASNFFVTEERMQEWLEDLLNASDQMILLGLFEGLDSVEMSDLANLKMSDVDVENRIVHTASGRNVKISNQLLEYILEADEELILTFKRKERFARTKLQEDGTILKRTARGGLKQTEEQKRMWLSIRYTKMMRQCVGESNFPRKKIAYSGMVNYINKRCEETGLTAFEFVKTPEYEAELKNQFGSMDLSGFFFREYGEYLV